MKGLIFSVDLHLPHAAPVQHPDFFAEQHPTPLQPFVAHFPHVCVACARQPHVAAEQHSVFAAHAEAQQLVFPWQLPAQQPTPAVQPVDPQHVVAAQPAHPLPDLAAQALQPLHDATTACLHESGAAVRVSRKYA